MSTQKPRWPDAPERVRGKQDTNKKSSKTYRKVERIFAEEKEHSPYNLLPAYM
jgi:hypothetical protein